MADINRHMQIRTGWAAVTVAQPRSWMWVLIAMGAGIGLLGASALLLSGLVG